MTKELFVSSTPHETKVGMVEDDQLAEVYLERENEYTLAGSIYKGRVTRVLPGMQSAFVDIGLERDAFLYVSDFMELEDQDELDEVPTDADRTSPAPEPRHQQQHQRDETHLALPEAQATASTQAQSQPQEHREAGQQPSENGDTANSGNRERGGWRGRRRRRGRRGERMPDSKFARPAGEAQRETPQRTEPSDRPERPDRPERNDRTERNERTERSNFGPPPGYQPMILPGESISKYSRLAQAHAAAPARAPSPTPSREIPAPPIAQTFPEDEPL